ncbi:MAG TPA: aminoacyl-tRNA hydrolase [Planctomycetaceae bacterium]|nr:aminoacyl-tRNA hydrolase [Planctomycetaceae bacterium]
MLTTTPLTITPDISIPLSEMRFTYVRSSGPGGQNVNKVASKAVLRWMPGGRFPVEVLARLKTAHPAYWTKNAEMVITSQRTRDAVKNREDCLEKLRALILAALVVPKPRIPTRPTKGSIRRRLENKARNAAKKDGRKNRIPEE